MSFSQQVASLSAFLPMSRSCFLLRPGAPRAGGVRGGLCGPSAEGGSRNPPTHHRDISQEIKDTTHRLCVAELAELRVAVAGTWSQVPKSPQRWLSLSELGVCTPQHTQDSTSDLWSSSSSIPQQQPPGRVIPRQCLGRTVPALCQGQAELGAGTCCCPWFSLLADELLLLPQGSSWVGFPQQSLGDVRGTQMSIRGEIPIFAYEHSGARTAQGRCTHRVSIPPGQSPVLPSATESWHMWKNPLGSQR